MKFLFLFLLLGFTTIIYCQKDKNLKLKKGDWLAELELNDQDILPFNLCISENDSSYELVVVNGEEHIKLNPPRISNDTFFVSFPVFNSELIFVRGSKKEISGFWYNYNKGKNYKIPFTSRKIKAARFKKVKKKRINNNLSGKWRVSFMPGTDSEYPAVGIFNQDKNNITGTFLTETGDYRYLAGNVTSDSLFLSCFDGSHAFLFKARSKNDSLYGSFFSGNHWQSTWCAVRDETFELADPEVLTTLKEGEEMIFSLPDLKENLYHYPNDDLLNKVVIIQIMGSWCPNCLDETTYFKDLYTKHHNKGLEIISIGYETGENFDDYQANIKRLKDNLDLDFIFLVGGSASKNLASEHFKMLSDIVSFPTTIFIGRDGEVKRVHTGFSGPGTGEYYDEYVKKTNAFIESLLAN